MFWRFGSYASISTLETVLDKPDVTVEELLEESDLIQELKQQNGKLIEFLRDEVVLKRLLDYVTAEKSTEDELEETQRPQSKDGDDKSKPSGISFFAKGRARSNSKASKGENDSSTDEQREDQRKKFSYLACEVLSSEVWSLTEALMEQHDHLRKFWSFIRRPAPLDALQAGYFTKVNEALLDKKTEEMLAFFKSLDNIVSSMLQHVDCPMVMDLLLKIISLEKTNGGQGIVDWLQKQDLIPQLLSFLSPEHNSSTQTSAGDFLKAIITISANATPQDQSVIGPNELTRQLVSQPCIERLINNMLLGGNPLTVGVGIIIEVIRKNNSDYDLDSQAGPDPKTTDPIYLGTLLRQFADSVPQFMKLVRSPASRKTPLKTAFRGHVEPLGFDRFKTCELMAELLHCSNMALLNEPGAEEDVLRRDAEREQLKNEGKLATPKVPSSPSQIGDSHDEFGSSVDSHGFHHARLDSSDEEKADDLTGRHESNVSLTDDDGFEQVPKPSAVEDLPDEVSFDEYNERVEETGLPSLTKVEKRDPTLRTPAAAGTPAAYLPPQAESSPANTTGDSPTAAGVTERFGSMEMDEDTVMTEFGEESPSPNDSGDELERELAKAERPAPLFASKKSPPGNGADKADDPWAEESQAGIDQSTATLQADEISAGQRLDSDRKLYEVEANGSPVVGDWLKIQFVDHQVVPTILDFFFRFPWNNFLHNVVYDVVQQVFNGGLERGYNSTLAFDVFTPVPLKDGQNLESLGLASGKDVTERILDGQRASDDSQARKGMRLGYMGHLTLVAEEVCKFGNRQPPELLDQDIHDRLNREEWLNYVNSTLTETREKDNAVLGGVRPENAMSVRQVGGGFSSNTANTLASAGIGTGVSSQDAMALSEGTVGQSFEINSGSMLGGFGDGDDDDDMEDEHGGRPGNDRRGSSGSHLSDDEQVGELSFDDVDMDLH
ncbi:SAPS-domain-containing protein [Polychaeton citri CBS 116435]|uniref:SAPS-domain-containing protein n=1 Tax=Polychaeton citri CBS 116435 TaxID=1314669 RepID=A0A9P4Q699_9PEZI|nr:SAPS-domain-containing protein [Polychaeton citri CBS 116435]